MQDDKPAPVKDIPLIRGHKTPSVEVSIGGEVILPPAITVDDGFFTGRMEYAGDGMWGYEVSYDSDGKRVVTKRGTIHRASELAVMAAMLSKAVECDAPALASSPP